MGDLGGEVSEWSIRRGEWIRRRKATVQWNLKSLEQKTGTARQHISLSANSLLQQSMHELQTLASGWAKMSPKFTQSHLMHRMTGLENWIV